MSVEVSTATISAFTVKIQWLWDNYNEAVFQHCGRFGDASSIASRPSIFNFGSRCTAPVSQGFARNYELVAVETSIYADKILPNWSSPISNWSSTIAFKSLFYNVYFRPKPGPRCSMGVQRVAWIRRVPILGYTHDILRGRIWGSTRQVRGYTGIDQWIRRVSMN